MAQSSQSLLYVCRTCRQQLQRQQPSPAIRTFTTTPRRRRTLPVFTPTSEPQLDQIFAEYREKVFTPAVLTSHHRSLIYRPTRHHIINNDPGVTVTLSNDEEVKLQPMDAWDRPNRKKSLQQIAAILGGTSESNAWANVPSFLEAMHSAHETIPPWFYEKLTRKANEQGKAGIIIRCAEMAKGTNVKLSNSGVTLELLLGCHQRASEANFKGEIFEKSTAQAEYIVQLLEKEEHCGGKLQTNETDMRKNLPVIGVLLELAAAKAINAQEGKDINGKLASYVTKALILSENGFVNNAKAEQARRSPSISKKQQSDGALSDEEAVARAGKQLQVDQSTKFLERFLPLWNGLRLAMQVDGISSGPKASELKQRFASLDKDVQESVKEVERGTEGKPTRGLMMYNTLKAS